MANQQPSPICYKPSVEHLCGKWDLPNRDIFNLTPKLCISQLGFVVFPLAASHNFQIYYFVALTINGSSFTVCQMITIKCSEKLIFSVLLWIFKILKSSHLQIVF